MKDPEKIVQVFNSSRDYFFFKKKDFIYCGYNIKDKKEILYKCEGIITDTKIDEYCYCIYIMYTLKNRFIIKKFQVDVQQEDGKDLEPELKDTITLRETHNFVSFNKIYSEEYKNWDSFEQSTIQPKFGLIKGELILIQNGSDKL
jgi:hypothetical protein